MIKANELRIGNWVEFQYKNNQSDYTEVCAAFLLRISQGKKDVNPIPLTPEILQKIKQVSFGFAENFTCYISRDGKILMEQYGEGQDELKHIKYLHQLQNLYFALTGEELSVHLDTETIK